MPSELTSCLYFLRFAISVPTCRASSLRVLMLFDLLFILFPFGHYYFTSCFNAFLFAMCFDLFCQLVAYALFLLATLSVPFCYVSYSLCPFLLRALYVYCFIFVPFCYVLTRRFALFSLGSLRSYSFLNSYLP